MNHCQMEKKHNTSQTSLFQTGSCLAHVYVPRLSQKKTSCHFPMKYMGHKQYLRITNRPSNVLTGRSDKLPAEQPRPAAFHK